MCHKKNYANESVKVCEHNPAIFSLAQFQKKSEFCTTLDSHLVSCNISPYLPHIMLLNVEN